MYLCNQSDGYCVDFTLLSLLSNFVYETYDIEGEEWYFIVLCYG